MPIISEPTHKTDVMKRLAKKLDLTITDTCYVYDGMCEFFKEELMDCNNVWLKGIGTLKVNEIPEMKYVNPSNPDEVRTCSSVNVRYSMATTFRQELKDAIGKRNK